ncbi:MAG: arginine--tRNA ligase [Gammaproteobacteria bacterium]
MHIKQHIQQSVISAVEALLTAKSLAQQIINLDIQIETARDPAHGDFATNVAMHLTKILQQSPRQIAEAIVMYIPNNPLIKKIEIAGPGFINFFVSDFAWHQCISDILHQAEHYGIQTRSNSSHINIEFVSANPTGPLHVGHGRSAAFGGALSDLLAAVGYQVHREYYVNDAGRQMNILATSVWLRYLQLQGIELPFPVNAYRGDYIYDIATDLYHQFQALFMCEVNDVLQGLPPDETDGGDKEHYIDAVIARCQKLLGEACYRQLFDFALQAILDDIRDDLTQFGVHYQEWFSERRLQTEGTLSRALQKLRDAGHTYMQDGAEWFRATAFGDEKDRVLVRENGVTTYFASDVAYYLNKIERGFNRLIFIFGADHHGYVPRLQAVVKALQGDESAVEVLLVQFATLYRGEEKIQMSTRSGEFVTLRQLREEVGADAARFFYVMRKAEQHMDFDLELAKSQSNDNPVYYIQYAHARICRVFQQLTDKKLTWDKAQHAKYLTLLTLPEELGLMKILQSYPNVVASAADNRAPHQVANYMRELANHFHSYYNAHPFIVTDEALRTARLSLIAAIQQVLRNGLQLLGVTAPERM